MKFVRDMLDALSSPGGNLMILCCAVIISGAAAIHEASHNQEVDNFLLSVFSGFTGALLQALTSRAWKPGEATHGELPK